MKEFSFLIAFAIGSLIHNSQSISQDITDLNLSLMLPLKITRELEISEEQKSSIEKAKQRYQAKMQELWESEKEAAKSGDNGKLAAFRKLATESEMKFNEEIWEVFVPQQRRLIARQSFWTSANSSSFRHQFSKTYFSDQLNISAEQQLRLTSEEEKLQKEFAAEFRKLREKHSRKLKQKILTKKQIQTLEELMGENIAAKGAVRF